MSDQRQLDNQTHRRRPVSAADLPYLLGALFMAGMRAIPASQRTRVIDKASLVLAKLLYVTNVHRTRTVRKNLNTLLGVDRSPEVTEADIQRFLSMTTWNPLIINSLPVLSQVQLVNLVRLEGLSYLDNHLASGHPVLVWSYHFGISPLIVAAVLHARGYPIQVIGYVRQMPARGSMLQYLYYLQLRRASNQLSMIDPGDGLQRQILDVLRNKECLCVTPDYMIPDDERHLRSAFEVPIDFLGRTAYLHTGGLRLAKRLGARVVTLLPTQTGANKPGLIVEPFELPTSGLTPAELQQDLQLGMRRLEVQILAHPYWWLDLKRNDLLQRLRTPQTEARKRTTMPAMTLEAA